MNWDTEAGGQWQEGEADGLRVYCCEKCGGEIVADETTGATACPYCGNPVVMMGQFAGDLKPDYVIPFKLDKKAAMEALRRHYNGKRLLPKVFADENNIQEIKGVYVPVWLFGADVQADLHWRGTRVRSSRSGDYIYTERRYYSVTRGGAIGFEQIPVDGSTKMDDTLMESIEPFDFSEAVDFQTAYLAGYLADRYDVTQEESVGRIKQRVENSVHDVLEDTVRQFGSIQRREGRVDVKQTNVKYALFPVWLLNTSWNGQIYTFAMNGQTGRFIGNLPVDEKLARLAVLKRTILYGIVIGIGTFLFLMW